MNLAKEIREFTAALEKARADGKVDAKEVAELVEEGADILAAAASLLPIVVGLIKRK